MDRFVTSFNLANGVRLAAKLLARSGGWSGSSQAPSGSIS